MKLFAQILKVDEAQRLVIGRAAQEVLDKSGEIFDYESSKPFFKEWSDGFAEDTEGKSLGNLRVMHGKAVAGKIVKMDFNDTEKAIDIEAKIVDDNEWNKVLEGCYTGFSIGGQYVGERKTEKVNDVEMQRYTARPSEISIVDSPCIPTAKFYDIVKADGSVLQKAFAVAEPNAPTEQQTGELDQLATVMNEKGLSLTDLIDIAKREFSQKEREAAAKSGEALKDGSFPIKSVEDLENAVKAYGRAKDKEAAKAHIIKRAKALGATDKLPADWEGSSKKEKSVETTLQKGMWDVQDFAGCLQSIACIARCAQWDLEDEGDGSPIPMQLRNWLSDGIGIFRAMADEETKEMLQSLKDTAGIGPDDEIEIVIEMASKIGALQKQLADPALKATDLLKIAGEHGEEVTSAVLADVPALAKRIVAKAKGKYSTADMDRLQAAHDHLADMGAECHSDDEEEDGEKSHQHGDLAKSVEREAYITQLEKRIEALEKQPVIHPATLAALKTKVVTKQQDAAQTIPLDALKVNPDTLKIDYQTDQIIYDADGSVDLRTTRLIKAHKLSQQAQG